MKIITGNYKIKSTGPAICFKVSGINDHNDKPQRTQTVHNESGEESVTARVRYCRRSHNFTKVPPFLRALILK